MSDEELTAYAFAPPEAAQSPEFREHVLPMLRSDLMLDGRAERRLSTLALGGTRLPAPVGLELFCGASDEVAPWKDAPGWQRLAEVSVGVHYMPGGHEFMQERRPELLAAWRRDVLGRLVAKRSAEVAMLAAQGYSAPAIGVAAAVPWIPASSSRSRGLPLYAVRWQPASEGLAGVPPQAHHVLDLGAKGGLSEAELSAAITAARDGKTLLATAAAHSSSTEAEVAQSWQFLRMVQALVAQGLACRIVLVLPTAAAGAMVAGASKAVAMEASELQLQRVFMPWRLFSSAGSKESAGVGKLYAQDICAQAARQPSEPDLWLRDGPQGQAFVPRLEHMASSSSRAPVLQRICTDGSAAAYVLTGATGGLGRAVVSWLLKDQGLKPEQLILLRRSGSAVLDGDLARCRCIEVAQPDSAAALKSCNGLQEAKGVLGVFHLAGMLDDGVLGSMTEERLRKVAAPKCGMLSALLDCAKEFSWPLQWTVGFSSTSSLFGYAGQSNYCAANAVIDQMAVFGAESDLPESERAPCRVMAINWGPWAEAGMAKVGTKAYEQALKEGDRPLPTATALACLAAALRMAGQVQPGSIQLCACDVDWARSQWSELPILELLMDRSGTPGKLPAGGTSAAKGSDSAVEDFLAQSSKASGGWPWIKGKSLHQLGLDSLELVQIRNQFNKKFSVNVPLAVVADPSQRLDALAAALAAYVKS